MFESESEYREQLMNEIVNQLYNLKEDEFRIVEAK